MHMSMHQEVSWCISILSGGLGEYKDFPLVNEIFIVRTPSSSRGRAKPASDIDIPHSGVHSHDSHLLRLSRFIFVFLLSSISASIISMQIN